MMIPQGEQVRPIDGQEHYSTRLVVGIYSPVGVREFYLEHEFKRRK
jgi:hypothetical protein